MEPFGVNQLSSVNALSNENRPERNTMAPSDEELVQSFQEGNQSALETIISLRFSRIDYYRLMIAQSS